MTAIHHPAPSNAAYVVPGPRATDAIGVALRGAYRTRGDLPADMIVALERLDPVTSA